VGIKVSIRGLIKRGVGPVSRARGAPPRGDRASDIISVTPRICSITATRPTGTQNSERDCATHALRDSADAGSRLGPGAWRSGGGDDGTSSARRPALTAACHTAPNGDAQFEHHARHFLKRAWDSRRRTCLVRSTTTNGTPMAQGHRRRRYIAEEGALQACSRMPLHAYTERGDGASDRDVRKPIARPMLTDRPRSQNRHLPCL